MNRRSEGSDRIVFGLVIVLGVLVAGVIALEIVEAISGSDTEIGPNVATLLATIGGAAVGGIAGYVTQKPPELQELSPAVEFVGGSPAEPAAEEPAYADEPEDLEVGSATESHGPSEEDYEDITYEFHER